ncbi:MAG: DUF4129 domain-containing protein [Clostridiaceae bacterium]|nr:DUF4129 domain-containing protein [Clostridiaceae bacterium]
MRKNMELLIYNIFAVLFSWSMVFSITDSMLFGNDPAAVFLYCAAALLVLNLLFINWITLLTGGIISFIATLSYGYWMVKMQRVPWLFRQVRDFGTWVYDYIMGYQYLNDVYSIWFTIIMAIAITATAFFIMVKRNRYRIALLGGTIYLVTSFYMGREINKPAMMVGIFVLICLYSRDVLVNKYSDLYKRNNNNNPYLLWAMPLAAIILFISYLLSDVIYYERPYWLDKGINSFSEWIEEQDLLGEFRQLQGSDFSLVSTGFQPDKTILGGDIKLDHRLVLKVKADHRVYLKGSIKDYYTGYSWISTNLQEFSISDNNIEDYVTDGYFSSRTFHNIVYRTRHGDFRVLSNTLNIYDSVFLTGRAEVEHINFKTNTLFHAGNLIEIEEDKYNKEYIITNSNAEFYFPGKQKSDNRYRYRYRMVNMNIPLTETLLKRSSQYIANPSLIIDPNVRGRYLEIQQRYTNVDNITERVAQLAREITQGYNSRYEKVKAIEQYLSNNFSYTLTPGPVPKGRDFADYFLFDLKKGYCTYFATAMTLMVRSIGIPARYVEGYVLPLRPGADNVYYVTNDLSHAWVEVFFDGFGWISFEPTPPFQAMLRDEEAQSLLPSSVEGENEQYIDSLLGTESPDSEAQSEETETAVDAREIFIKNGYTILILFLILIASLIGVGVLFIIIRRLMFLSRLRNIRRMDARAGILEIYPMLLRVASFYGCELNPGETPLEYAQRVNERFKGFSPDSFRDITEIYVKAKYSREEMVSHDKERMISFYNSMVAGLRDRLNKILFCYLRYMKQAF